MQNNKDSAFKNSRFHPVISALAISSLLLVVTGCDSTMKESRPTDSVANMASNPDRSSLPNKNNSDYKAVSKDGFIAADDSDSTSDGIAQVITANNQFAIDMYQQINGQPEQADKNVFFSPYSLSTAMAMLYAAAEGETKQQIQNTFHYPTPTILNPNSAALYNQFNKPNPNYDLNTVNDLWMRQGLSPNQTYLDTVRRYYGGQVTNLDFENSPEPSRLIINKKIAQYTKQMIPELLPSGSIESTTSAVLTNAVYFKSEWAQPLALRNWKQPFYNLDGTTTDTNLMYSIKHFDYMEDEQVQVVELPYKGDDLSMLILLPKSKEAAAMQKLITNLSTTQINKWTEQLKNQEIFLIMPKFKLQQSYQMESLLSKMGMPIAFGGHADFSLFNDELPLVVNSITHKAVVEVDEKGTVAAAATGISIVPVSASYNAEFTADHPFIFMIKDNKTDAILFLGQVNKL